MLAAACLAFIAAERVRSHYQSGSKPKTAQLVGVRASSTQPTTQTSRATYSAAALSTDFDRDDDKVIFTAPCSSGWFPTT
jgi:hypothetical protein